MLKKGSEKFEYFFQGRRDVSKSKDKKFELTFKESEPYGLDEQRIEIEKNLKIFHDLFEHKFMPMKQLHATTKTRWRKTTGYVWFGSHPRHYTDCSCSSRISLNKNK